MQMARTKFTARKTCRPRCPACRRVFPPSRQGLPCYLCLGGDHREAERIPSEPSVEQPRAMPEPLEEGIEGYPFYVPSGDDMLERRQEPLPERGVTHDADMPSGGFPPVEEWFEDVQSTAPVKEPATELPAAAPVDAMPGADPLIPVIQVPGLSSPVLLVPPGWKG